MAILGPGNGTLQNGVLTDVTSVPSFIATDTKMIFEQTSAPTSWTKVTTGVDNFAMRVITGTAAPGGTVAFSTVFSTARAVSGTVGQQAGGGTIGPIAAGGSVGQRAGGGTVGGAGANISGHTLSLAQIPPHGHPYNNRNLNLRGTPTNTGAAQVAVAPLAGGNTGGAGGGQAHTHGSPNHAHPFSGAQHNHPFAGTAHNHPFTGAQHVHPFSATANLNVFYVDVIIATKN
jgi:hypothetical protein